MCFSKIHDNLPSNQRSGAQSQSELNVTLMNLIKAEATSWEQQTNETLSPRGRLNASTLIFRPHHGKKLFPSIFSFAVDHLICNERHAQEDTWIQLLFKFTGFLHMN